MQILHDIVLKQKLSKYSKTSHRLSKIFLKFYLKKNGFHRRDENAEGSGKHLHRLCFIRVISICLRAAPDKYYQLSYRSFPRLNPPACIRVRMKLLYRLAAVTP